MNKSTWLNKNLSSRWLQITNFEMLNIDKESTDNIMVPKEMTQYIKTIYTINDSRKFIIYIYNLKWSAWLNELNEILWSSWL